MSTEENKKVVNAFIDRLFQTRDLAVLDQTMPADVVAHPIPSGYPMGDRAGLRDSLQKLFAAFPDLRVSVRDLIAENDTVVVRGTIAGTQAGEYKGIPPMGKHFSVPTLQVMEVREGKIVELWFQHDSLSIVEQLGGRVSFP